MLKMLKTKIDFVYVWGRDEMRINSTDAAVIKGRKAHRSPKLAFLKILKFPLNQAWQVVKKNYKRWQKKLWLRVACNSIEH